LAQNKIGDQRLDINGGKSEIENQLRDENEGGATLAVATSHSAPPAGGRVNKQLERSMGFSIIILAGSQGFCVTFQPAQCLSEGAAMPRHVFVALRDVLASLAQRSDGSIATTFAIALIPIMIGVGAAVDYSHLNSYKTAMQAALDAAVLAGAKNGTLNWSATALNVFNGDLSAKFGSPPTPTFAIDAVSGNYTGVVTGALPTYILEIVHIPTISATVRSEVAAGASGQSCILTYDKGKPTSDVSIALNGAPSVNLSGCSLRSNTSIDCHGHDGNVTQTIAAGTVSGCGHAQSGASVVKDIYTPLAANITQKCGGARPGVNWVGGGAIPAGAGVITVNKGAYTEYHICGDLNFSGDGYLTGSSPASDSVIIVENGSINLANDAEIKAMRTAIVMTGNNNYASQINYPNGASKKAELNLSMATDASNPWQGVALYLDPSLTKSVDNTWGPGAELDVVGLVYLGNSNVRADGKTTSSNAKCTKFVMNSFTNNGNVDLKFDGSVKTCASAVSLADSGGTFRLAK
jgi:hypothetical protein